MASVIGCYLVFVFGFSFLTTEQYAYIIYFIPNICINDELSIFFCHFLAKMFFKKTFSYDTQIKVVFRIFLHMQKHDNVTFLPNSTTSQ